MDFRTKIQELIEQGKSFDEISKMFESEFNAAMVAASEENLDAMYESALDALDAALQDDNLFTKDTVADAAVCWAIEKHDDWGKEEIELVKETIAVTLEILETSVKALKPLLEQETKDCKCGSHDCKFDPKFKLNHNDTDAIKKFLTSL